MRATLCAGREEALNQDRFPSRRTLQFGSLQNRAAFQIVLRAQHPAPRHADHNDHCQCDPNQKVDALHGDSFQSQRILPQVVTLNILIGKLSGAYARWLMSAMATFRQLTPTSELPTRE